MCCIPLRLLAPAGMLFLASASRDVTAFILHPGCTSRYHTPHRRNSVSIQSTNGPPTSTFTSTFTSTASSIQNRGSGGAEGSSKISRDLVDALDLYPLMEQIAKHAATKRARDAILHLVIHDDDDVPGEGRRRELSAWKKNHQMSKRREVLNSMTMTSSSFSGSHGIDKSRSGGRHILQVAQSAEDARNEWMLVKEASSILHGHYHSHDPTIRRQSSKSTSSSHRHRPRPPLLPLPPIYGADSSSPWDISHEVDTDDDEWLYSILNGWTGPLDLQHILQADQVVQRIVKTHQWSSSQPIRQHARHLIEHTFGNDENENENHVHAALASIQNEIQDTVRIVRGTGSYADPSGLRTYSFQLDESKFPNLAILRRKEDDLVQQSTDILKGLLSNKKYVAQLSGFSRRRPEPYELDGRLVVAAPRDVATRIGIIRGNSSLSYNHNDDGRKGSSSSSFCYVEPNEVVQIGNELESIRDEIRSVSKEISNHLSGTIVRGAAMIHRGSDSVARLDAIFARAAFGRTLNGFVPLVGDEGVIDVKDFVHPILATRNTGGGGVRGGSNSSSSSSSRTIPIDLKLSGEDGERTLIISGPNGGGKSLAMKSFGLVAMMNKLSILIPRNDYSHREDNTRVDFFHDILVEVGDHQNVIEGESTYMAQLNSLSNLLQRIHPPGGEMENGVESNNRSSLILLDELGGGTDPTAGSCIAQAILEKIMEKQSTRTVVTTHSTQLKALSINDDRFNSASVLLQIGDTVKARFRLPTYKLCYGTVGNSYALGAASRSNPSLPEDVLDRAASLIASSQDENGEYLRLITEALEQEKENLFVATEATQEYKNEIIQCRDAIVSMARSYDQHLSRIESRLDAMLNEMMNDESRSTYDIVGDTVSTLRLVKKETKSKEEMLTEKGMRMVSISDKLMPGDRVTIIGREHKGEVARVSDDQTDVAFDEILIDLEFEYGLSPSGSKPSLVMKRLDLAIWDYPSMEDDWSSMDPEPRVRSIPDSRNRLLSVLSTLSVPDGPKKSSMPRAKKVSNGSKFTSSRERKAANKKTNKTKKKKRY